MSSIRVKSVKRPVVATWTGEVFYSLVGDAFVILGDDGERPVRIVVPNDSMEIAISRLVTERGIRRLQERNQAA